MFLWNLLFEPVKVRINSKNAICLNPCFCGTTFRGKPGEGIELIEKCLNPCFCGTYFSSLSRAEELIEKYEVLILVFVELTFRD